MAKLSLSRLLDATKLLATEAGKELQDLITFVNDVTDQFARALRNNLNFQDNFSAKVSTIELSQNEYQVVSTDGKKPVGIFPIKVSNGSATSIDTFTWYIDNQGKTLIKVKFDPAITSTVGVTIVILF
jgi:hypothetical protein